MTDPLRAAWLIQDLDHIQRARSLEAIRRIKDGTIRVPLACGWCGSSTVTSVGKEPSAINPHTYENVGRADPTDLRCVQCARITTLATAHKLRRQKLAAIIRRGVDVDVTRPTRGTPHHTT